MPLRRAGGGWGSAVAVAVAVGGGLVAGVSALGLGWRHGRGGARPHGSRGEHSSSGYWN
jgi:hypothetical protein